MLENNETAQKRKREDKLSLKEEDEEDEEDEEIGRGREAKKLHQSDINFVHLDTFFKMQDRMTANTLKILSGVEGLLKASAIGHRK